MEKGPVTGFLHAYLAASVPTARSHVKSTLSWAAVWIAILTAGFWVSQRLLAPPPVSVTAHGAGEIAIAAARNGHFYVDGSINGVPLQFMVDTGATYVAVDAGFARRAGMPEGSPGYFNTANGAVAGRVVKHQRVRVQSLEVKGLTVAVMPDAGADGLLGQNFLRHFDVTQSSGVMRLRARKGEPPR
jgi:aspartyl protease family protein